MYPRNIFFKCIIWLNWSVTFLRPNWEFSVSRKFHTKRNNSMCSKYGHVQNKLIFGTRCLMSGKICGYFWPSRSDWRGWLTIRDNLSWKLANLQCTKLWLTSKWYKSTKVNFVKREIIENLNKRIASILKLSRIKNTLSEFPTISMQSSVTFLRLASIS